MPTIQRRRLLLSNTTPAFDPDAAVFVANVEANDGQALEPAVKLAYNDFIVGLKTDGILQLIKSCCILAGARTLSGAMTPLVGVAPTNFNFVSADYDRKTGLKGDGSTKYLNTNFSLNSTYQNNLHMDVWRTEAEGTSGTEGLIGNESGASGAQITTTSTSRIYRANNSGNNFSDNSRHLGFVGVSRESSTDMSYRYNKVTANVSVSSGSVFFNNITIFTRNENNTSSARISFYSIGESINLALLDTRVTTLMNTLDAIL
jgi:hypothetical protein